MTIFNNPENQDENHNDAEHNESNEEGMNSSSWNDDKIFKLTISASQGIKIL
jgi:hypothetical protein